MKTPVANLYTDFSGFDRMRAQARDNSAAGRQAAAQQIESMFLGMMIKSMRAAGGSMLSGTGAQVREGMFDSQLALSMSKNSQLGFADMMLREFNLREGKAQDPNANSAGLDLPGKTAGQVPVGHFANSLWGRAVAPAEVSKPTSTPVHTARVGGVKGLNPGIVIDAKPTPHASQPPAHDNAERPVSWHNADEFAAHLWPAAQRAAEALGTQPQAVLAVAALETGWGQHLPTAKNGVSSNNLFGIKAHGWTGPVSHTPTLEFESGRFVHKVEPFRSYDSTQRSVEDFVQFIKSRPRYAGVVNSGGDPVAFVRALQQAGYATDPNYAGKLETLMRSETMRKVQTITAAGSDSAITSG